MGLSFRKLLQPLPTSSLIFHLAWKPSCNCLDCASVLCLYLNMDECLLVRSLTLVGYCVQLYLVQAPWYLELRASAETEIPICSYCRPVSVMGELLLCHAKAANLKLGDGAFWSTMRWFSWVPGELLSAPLATLVQFVIHDIFRRECCS